MKEENQSVLQNIHEATRAAVEGKSAYELTLDHEERLRSLEYSLAWATVQHEDRIRTIERALREYIEEAPFGLSSARSKARRYLGPEA